MDNDTLAITLLSHITKLSAGCSAAKQTVAMANMANAAVKSLLVALRILFGIHYHPIGGTDSFLLIDAYSTITLFSRQ